MKASLGSRIFDSANTALMLVLIAVMLYPIVFVFSASFSNPALVASGQVRLLPQDWTWIAYERILFLPDLWISYWNTIRYTVVQTVLTLIVTAMMAYPLAKRWLPGRRAILLMAAFTLLFNGGLIPTFLVVQHLGLLNSIWAIVLPTLVNTWYLFIMRTFFEALPKELEDAATMDGCSTMGVLLRIVMPLSLPVMLTIGLFTAVGQWNSFFDALIYLSDRDKYPLQILLRNIIIAGSGSETYMEDGGATFVETVKYSTIMIATLPILCIYPFIQKYFVQGSMIGGIKG
ncbi:carbohydrate ABC transporter permease [Paenibacillus sp. J5C_2022]|uniref:carbohydrate ABC transporter permease n=1 Tax=Paenibacillus sp. J5C2022 TaxID=2977129 RepID=UPI0021CF2692|nr:carbohydrate ABC transporter permease [Paenibacillus sp. J5C2022]MCU6708904.1 carbohydrate ABC transporter permease [Paenibacillus sp. J5C2022]